MARGARSRRCGRTRASSRASGSNMPKEGELVYGIEPRWHDRSRFAALRRAPGGASRLRRSRGRVSQWLDRVAVPSDASSRQAFLGVGGRAASAASETIGLPEGEDFELELVTDKRWLGYAEYLGGLRTRISVSIDLRSSRPDLVNLTAHEIYGGHHAARLAGGRARPRPESGEVDAHSALGAFGRDRGGHRDHGPASLPARAGAGGGSSREARLRVRRGDGRAHHGGAASAVAGHGERGDAALPPRGFCRGSARVREHVVAGARRSAGRNWSPRRSQPVASVPAPVLAGRELVEAHVRGGAGASGSS